MKSRFSCQVHWGGNGWAAPCFHHAPLSGAHLQLFGRKKSLKTRISTTTQKHLTSIYSVIDHRDNGNVLIAWELSDALLTKFVGASCHPDEVVSMSQSSQSILDHITNFLKFISNTQSFWFMLDTSYNHGCHLANRFRLEPNNYEVYSLLPAWRIIPDLALQ